MKSEGEKNEYLNRYNLLAKLVLKSEHVVTCILWNTTLQFTMFLDINICLKVRNFINSDCLEILHDWKLKVLFRSRICHVYSVFCPDSKYREKSHKIPYFHAMSEEELMHSH